ncbi:unnamed protein product, partial [Durusdinium trenchii]
SPFPLFRPNRSPRGVHPRPSRSVMGRGARVSAHSGAVKEKPKAKPRTRPKRKEKTKGQERTASVSTAGRPAVVGGSPERRRRRGRRKPDMEELLRQTGGGIRRYLVCRPSEQDSESRTQHAQGEVRLPSTPEQKEDPSDDFPSPTQIWGGDSPGLSSFAQWWCRARGPSLLGDETISPTLSWELEE